MPTRTTAANRTDTDAAERAVADAQASAVVVWRGEPLAFASVPDRIAELPGRRDREALFGAYREALEALNPAYQRRFEAWTAAGDPRDSAAAAGADPRQLAADLERFVLHSETPYYAALRRYLATIDIEQGDATIADLWHMARASAWEQWFGRRDAARAVAATGRAVPEADGDGWRYAEDLLAGDGADHPLTGPAAAARAAWTTLVGSPEWLTHELGVAPGEVPSLADYVALVHLWRLRHQIGLLHYELRLFADPDDPALQRAYYSGVVGHMIGVAVPEEDYLHAVSEPFASARAIETTLLAGQLVEVLEGRFGSRWWREAGAAEVIGGVAEASSVQDALAYLGYDALDWRPVLRQIRTRLIGEMSGYGGPNITTRAGTRKV